MLEDRGFGLPIASAHLPCWRPLSRPRFATPRSLPRLSCSAGN